MLEIDRLIVHGYLSRASINEIDSSPAPPKRDPSRSPHEMIERRRKQLEKELASATGSTPDKRHRPNEAAQPQQARFTDWTW
jgi:hypothetical protein